MAKLVREVMLRDPLTVPADMPYLSLVHMFVAAEVGGVPVVDPGGRVVGLVTTQDLLRIVDQVCDEDLDEGEPDHDEDDGVVRAGAGEDDGDAGDGDREVGAILRSLTAGDVAGSDIYWVDEDAPIAPIVAEMRSRGLHRALVGREGQLRGMLTTFYLLAALEHAEAPGG
jgi:CBS domain-containing protein